MRAHLIKPSIFTYCQQGIIMLKYTYKQKNIEGYPSVEATMRKFLRLTASAPFLFCYKFILPEHIFLFNSYRNTPKK